MTIKERLLIELNITIAIPPADPTTDENLLDNTIWQAEGLVRNKRRTSADSDIEERFQFIVYQIALRLWNIRGFEGETTHKENGVERTYISDGQIQDLLKQIPSSAIAGS